MPRYVGVLSKPSASQSSPVRPPPPSSGLNTSRVAPESDYGSDFDTEDEDVIDALLDDIERKRRVHEGVATPVHDDIEDADLIAAEVTRRVVSIATASHDESDTADAMDTDLPVRRPGRGPSIEVEYDSASRHSWAVAKDDGRRPDSESQALKSQPALQNEDDSMDTRTPLERFRSKRPLSVTDLVSPAWCEMQYYFSLSKHGRVRRTAEMKAGSKVHRELEMQVHDVVPVDVQTREDTWGLRIWNVIQGLRTLRATGMTRELEVWAQVDGEVVNGVIDELSHECPDAELQAGIDASLAESLDGPPPDGRRIYLTDVKSRALRNRGSLPSGAALRPVQMQLMLYRHLLLTLNNSTIADAEPILVRARVDPRQRFSDEFISEISSLDFNFLPDGDDASKSLANGVPLASQERAAHELLEHNSPLGLWALMLQEVAATFGPSPHSRISPVLRAEFRAQGSGEFLGQRTFTHDSTMLEGYVADELRWWRGQRDTRGVPIQEAYKCGRCEFAEGCEWRLGKVQEGIEKMRMRGQGRGSKPAV